MSEQRIQAGGLQISKVLYDLLSTEIAPGTGIDADAFWEALGRIVAELAPRNEELLRQREALQRQIDDWHLAHRNRPHDHAAYKHFLQQIGYLLPEGEDFRITTANVDPEQIAFLRHPRPPDGTVDECSKPADDRRRTKRTTRAWATRTAARL